MFSGGIEVEYWLKKVQEKTTPYMFDKVQNRFL